VQRRAEATRLYAAHRAELTPISPNASIYSRSFDR
jgi:hypothetical protein